MAFRDPERKKEYDIQHKEENKEYYQQYFQDYRLENAEHIKTYNRLYVETHKEERWEKKLIRVFGPNAVSQYYSLLSSQNDCCAICLINSPEPYAHFQIDHRHVPGFDKEPFTMPVLERWMYVRGLLCHKCNKALGLMEDDPDLLTQSSEYLRKHARQ